MVNMLRVARDSAAVTPAVDVAIGLVDVTAQFAALLLGQTITAAIAASRLRPAFTAHIALFARHRLARLTALPLRLEREAESARLRNRGLRPDRRPQHQNQNTEQRFHLLPLEIIHSKPLCGIVSTVLR